MYRVLLFTIVCLVGLAAPAVGQDAPSSNDSTLVKEVLYDYDKRLRYTLIVDPFALYSRTFGFGIAAHFTAYNFLWPGSRWRVSARPSERRGIYQLSLRTHDPATSNVYGLLHGTYYTTSAYRYHGIGQSTLLDNLIVIDHDYVDAVARVGFEFMDDRLTIQPMVAYLWNKAEEGDDGIDSVFVNLDLRSQEALLYAIGYPIPGYDDPSNVHQAIRFGVDFALDYRDRRAYPLSGVIFQGGWEHYQSLSDQDVVFDRFDASVAGFWNVTASHVAALRILAQKVENGGDDPIPFYLLPYLDFHKLGGYRNERHINADLLTANLEYRWPLINLVDLYQASAFVEAGVGAVYDDLFDDFEFGLSFAHDPAEGSNALRPGFGLGLRVSGLEQEVDYIQWMLGFGPEGVTLMSFHFVFEIGENR
jgi:outer membrane protein assembly factor BamA